MLYKFYLIFSDNEEEKQNILKQLREVLIANCMESARIKAANEIKEHLECMSEFDSEEDVKNITIVMILLQIKKLSVIF